MMDHIRWPWIYTSKGGANDELDEVTKLITGVLSKLRFLLMLYSIGGYDKIS
jgi:hypothetical protein